MTAPELFAVMRRRSYGAPTERRFHPPSGLSRPSVGEFGESGRMGWVTAERHPSPDVRHRATLAGDTKSHNDAREALSAAGERFRGERVTGIEPA